MSKRAPLLPWSKSKWSSHWCSIRRMGGRAIPRTKFVLLKSPVSTLYEERFGGDLHVFTVPMYCNRMMSKGISVGMAIDCTALDLHLLDEDILSGTSTSTSSSSKDDDGTYEGKPTVRYWHDTNEWDDFDVEYQKLEPESGAFDGNANDTASYMYIIPSQQIITKFISLCQQHWKMRPNTHIAVFDSRGGIGAASFLVSCFMCHKLKAPVHVAIASIQTVMEEAGSTGMYDESLLRYLQKTFRGRKELVVPDRPKWAPAIADAEMEEDDENEEEINAHNDTDTDTTSTKDKDKDDAKKRIVIPPWTEPIKLQLQQDTNTSSSSMLPPPPKKMKTTQSTETSTSLMPLLPSSSKYTRAMSVVSQLMNNKIKTESPSQFQKPLHLYTIENMNIPVATTTNGNGSDTNTYPCASIIVDKESFEKTMSQHSACISKNQYVVTWIPGGKQVKRGFLLLLQDGVFFLSSSNNRPDNNIHVEMLVKNIFMPRPSNPAQPQHRTLLDGFLVFPSASASASASDPQNSKVMFYTFDIVTMEGGVVHHKPLGKRIAYLKGGVMDPRLKWKQQQQQQSKGKGRGNNEVVDILQLEFRDLKQTEEVWNERKKIVGSDVGNDIDIYGGLLFMNKEMSDGKGGFMWMENRGDLSWSDMVDGLKNIN